MRETMRAAKCNTSPLGPFADEACSGERIPRDPVCDVLSFTIPELAICLAHSRYSVNSG